MMYVRTLVHCRGDGITFSAGHVVTDDDNSEILNAWIDQNGAEKIRKPGKATPILDVRGNAVNGKADG